MPDRQHIYIKPHRDELSGVYKQFWSSVKRLLNWIGHDRLPEFAKVAMSVAKSAGQVSLQSEPYPVPAEGCSGMTVMSANLWHDWPRHRGMQKRLESFAELVQTEQADLVLLQEVARTRSFYADEWLAQRLQMAHVYTRANGSRKLGFEEGLGVYSRFPMKKLPFVRQMSQAHNPFSRRVALGVEVDTPCGEIVAFSAHLGLARKQNAKQLREMHGWVDEMSSGRSAIIAGDFNTSEHTSRMKYTRSLWLDTFRDIHEQGHASTHEIKWPWGGVFLSHRLDYIFLQPGEPSWQVIDVKHIDAYDGPHSDHRAVLAKLASSHLSK